VGLIGRRTGTRPSFSRAGYAGEYEYPGYGVIYVDVDGRRLTMRYNQIVTLFEHWRLKVFNGPENVAELVFHNTKLQFVSGLQGHVKAVLITMDPLVPPIRFERRPDAQLHDPTYLARLTGRYAMQAGGEAVVGLRGDRLTLGVPDNPLSALQPDRDNDFVLARAQRVLGALRPEPRRQRAGAAARAAERRLHGHAGPPLISNDQDAR
jgi:hypothetical protein